MSHGAVRKNLSYLAALAGVFALMSVHAPGARSQAPTVNSRMTFMHFNAQRHMSFVDTAQYPSSTSLEKVGKFLEAIGQPTYLIEGRPFPGWMNPDFIYGISVTAINGAGTGVRRIGPTGSQIGVADFGGVFRSINGGYLFTKTVPGAPLNTIPSAVDLKDHYVLVGELDPLLSGGNTTGMMLLEPQTMSAFRVGATNMFFAPTSSVVFRSVTCGVYPGLDGDFNTSADNEYRYVVGFVQIGGNPVSGLICMSLNEFETMNGSGNDPWNPVEPTRGPDFTNAHPRMDANSNYTAVGFDGGIAVSDPAQIFCRSYYLRAGIPGCAATPDRVYVIGGYAREILIQANPPTFQWRPILGAYSLGGGAAIAGPVTLYTGGPPWHPFCTVSLTPECFRYLEIVGDWAFGTVGDGVNADGFGDLVHQVYIPEMIDGAGDFDDGYRGSWVPGTVSAGAVGYMPAVDGTVYATYFGTGIGSSTVFATTRNIYQNYGNFASAGPLISVSMHTDQELQLGLNIRQAPQPFVGFHMSDDPVQQFDGGKNVTKDPGAPAGACSGSAAGGASGTIGLLALIGLAFLAIRVVREAHLA